MDKSLHDKRNLVARNPAKRLTRTTRREALFARGYALAWKEAAIETALPLDHFPKAPPFTVDALESADFWPEGLPTGDGGA
jgi:hypothetical protein